MNRTAALSLGAAGAIAAAGTAAYARRPRLLVAPPGTQTLIDGAMIHYVEEGEGPPIVLVHGFGASLFSWREVIPRLAVDYRVAALDLPAFGFSSRDATLDLSHGAQAERVIGLMDALGMERAVLAGHSMGGGIALRAAMAHPDRIAGLVLIAATDPLDPTRFASGQRRARVMVPAAAFAFRIRPLARTAMQRGLAQMMTTPGSPDDEMVEGYLRPLTLPGTGRALTKLFVDVLAEPLPSGELPSVPCVSISGERDTVILPSVGERLAGRLAGTEYRLLEGAGHMMTDEQPAEVAEAIRGVARRAFAQVGG